MNLVGRNCRSARPEVHGSHGRTGFGAFSLWAGERASKSALRPFFSSGFLSTSSTVRDYFRDTGISMRRTARPLPHNESGPNCNGLPCTHKSGASPIEGAARLSLQRVAQISNLPYRGIAFRVPSAGTSQRNVSTLCRLQIGETAESNSALQGCPCPSSIGDAPAHAGLNGFSLSQCLRAAIVPPL